jgi:hypothetical protein
VTRPEAVRGMIDAMLHILAKDPGEQPAKKAKRYMKHARLSAKQWTTAEDDRLRSLVISGMNAWSIAAELERTVAAVGFRAERFGLSLRRVTVAPSRRQVGLKVKGK